MCVSTRRDGKRVSERLGILLMSDQGHCDLDIICGLSKAAAKMGVQVEVFLMGDGVRHLGDPRLEKAIREGARVSFCALNAMERSLNEAPQYPWGAKESTQYDLACIVERSDRFLSFT